MRPAVREKKSLRDSLWFNNRHTLGPYRGLNQSESEVQTSFLEGRAGYVFLKGCVTISYLSR